MNITELVKNKKAHFVHFREGNRTVTQPIQASISISMRKITLPTLPNPSHSRPAFRAALCLATIAAFALVACAERSVPSLSDSLLESLVGARLQQRLETVRWQTTDPPRLRVPVYRVRVDFQREFFLSLAATLGLKGEIKPTRLELGAQPGYCIEEGDSAKTREGGSLVFYTSTGEIAFYANDDGYREDRSMRRPEISRVPEPEEARDKALALLPALGLTTNDLQLRSDGTLAWSSVPNEISYTDRLTRERKRWVMARHVIFNQRITGGKVVSVGGGGRLRVGFISDGKLSMIELMFRRGPVVAEADPLSRDVLIAALKERKAWTWKEPGSSNLVVTNCAVVYPQANGSIEQPFLWPFYELKGFTWSGSTTGASVIYVPFVR